MVYAGINYLAVFVAAVAAWLCGAAWYAALGKHWMKAARLDPGRHEDARRAFRHQLRRRARHRLGARRRASAISAPARSRCGTASFPALFIWAGFIATVIAVNHAIRASAGI